MFVQKKVTSPPGQIRAVLGLVFIALLTACSAGDDSGEKPTAVTPPANAGDRNDIPVVPEKSVAQAESVQPELDSSETATPATANQPDSSNAYDVLADLESLAWDDDADRDQQASYLLQRLRLQGANALIPIRDFLLDGDHFVDAPPKLRQALLSVLLSLGVPEVDDVALQLLASGPAAPEVLQLALYLEGVQPGKYSDSIRLAAEQTLIDTDPTSVLPPEFFTLLGEMGNQETAMLLAGTPLHDEAYASFALASIPDGSGLLRLEQDARLFEAGRDTLQGRLAIQLLAQKAPGSPRAAAALIELAEKGVIPNDVWPYLLDIVAGNWELTLLEPPSSQLVGSHTFFSPEGNQVIYRATLQPAQADDGLQSQRLYLLDRLQELAPSSF